MARLNSNGSSITDLVGVIPASSFDGKNRVWPFPELGAETFKAGEMVCLSGSTANAVGITIPGTDASGYGIIGFAADNATGSTSSFKGVHIATPDVVFMANVGHSVTSAGAQTAATDLGQLYGLTSLSGRTYVDKQKTGTSNVACRVIGFSDTDAVPTFYGKVKFVVLAPKIQLNNSMWLTSSPLGMAV
jgi:hypothetical protein